MRRTAALVAIAASLLLAGCDRAPAPKAAQDNGAQSANDTAAAPAPIGSGAEAGNAAATDPGLIPPSRLKVPLGETTLDGAQRVAKGFVSLTLGKRPDDASKLWRDDERSRAAHMRGTEILLARHYAFAMTYKQDHSEGAAGSLFTEVPTDLYYDDNGQHMLQRVTWTLRRVNDVPGATPEQLSWRLVDAKIEEPGPSAK